MRASGHEGATLVKRIILLLAFVFGAHAAVAQEKPTAPVEAPQAAADQQVPLRVQVVVSRYRGEKKISSVPYTLAVVANQRDSTSMRMGIQVPVPTTVFKGSGESSTPMTSYNYRNVGTNIDCTARTVGAGQFKLTMTVEDTSVFVPEKEGDVGTGVSNVPAFRTFTSRFDLLLRDGQTGQHTAATDPVSGEVLRVDVTMNVLK
jgi:Bacterial type II and III secretion system protein